MSLQSQRDNGRVEATRDAVTVMNQARRATDNVLQVKIQIQTKTGKLTSNGVHPNEALNNGNVWVHIECEVTSGEFQVSNKFTKVRCNTIAFSKKIK